MQKFIDFIITQKCTYNCSYCSQSKSCVNDKMSATTKTIDSFIKFLDKITSDFEITITGGEAILHPFFTKLISRVNEKGFKINLITNFSFDIKTYIKIFDLLKNNLNIYDISFHLDEIKNFDETLIKLDEFIHFKPDNTKLRFLIPIYNIDQNKETKIQRIIEIAKRHNIEYEFQKIRFLNKYLNSSFDKKYFPDFKPIKSKAKMCSSGQYSAVIYEDGSVYRCYSSRFFKSNYLGNINDEDFFLNNCPKVCTHDICGCPKPAKYGQILDEKNYFSYIKEKTINNFALLGLIFKNSKTILIKMRQFLSKN